MFFGMAMVFAAITLRKIFRTYGLQAPSKQNTAAD